MQAAFRGEEGVQQIEAAISEQWRALHEFAAYQDVRLQPLSGPSHYFTIDPLDPSGVATRVPRAEFDRTLRAGGFAAAHLDVNWVGRMLADLGRVPLRAWVHREFHSPLRRGDTVVEAPGQDWCILA